MRPPEDLFDRQPEWDRLVAFATDPQEGALLGIFWGRRRLGKSFLLQGLCEQVGGFYFHAVEGSTGEQLRLLGARLGQHLGAPGPIALEGWEGAVDALLRLGAGSGEPTLAVLDEFPYLAAPAAGLPSTLQAALAPRRPLRRSSRTRLVICGSAMAVMSQLLAGTAPLRGRAGLEMQLRPFDFRTAAQFWSIDDPVLAIRVFSVVGGVPAYRRELVRGDAPRDLGDFDAWVCRAVLDPSMPLFGEGSRLPAEDPTLERARGLGLYHSVLSAVASGRGTTSGIADFVDRRKQDLTHVIDVLVSAGFLSREEDALRRQRPTYHLADPHLRFHHAVMRPRAGELSGRVDTGALWDDAQGAFLAQVVGPTFEELCREWTLRFAAAATTGGRLARVARTEVNDRARRRQLEIDVVGLGVRDGAGQPVRVLGEAKFGQILGTEHLDRLRRARDLLADRYDIAGVRFLLFSAAGFSEGLEKEAEGPDVELVDLERLYHGS